MIERYPFFVYGTLILGQPNDHYWNGCIETAEPAHLPNGRLYDMGAFPMLLEGGLGPVKGQIIYPLSQLSDGNYQLLVQRLDKLENYDPDAIETSPYYRVLRTVLVRDNSPVTAWVYLGRPTYTAGRPVINSGDWISHSAKVHSHLSIWWEKHGQDLLFEKQDNDTSGKDVETW